MLTLIFSFLMILLFLLSLIAQEIRLNDLNVFNNIHDFTKFEKSMAFTYIPNAIIMATIPKNTQFFRIETGDPSEIGHYWFCIDPRMCAQLGGLNSTFSVYKTTTQLRIMVLSGRSTFLPSFESIFYYGNLDKGNDWNNPELFCHLNDQNGTLIIHGYARFDLFWEFVLCRTERYMELIRQVQFDRASGSLFSGAASFFHSREKIMKFDWTSLVLLQPEFKNKNWHIDPRGDHWRVDRKMLEQFRQSVYENWKISNQFPIQDLQEYEAIQSIETRVDFILKVFIPILKKRNETYSAIKEVLDIQLQIFGNSYSEAVEQCKSFHSITENKDLISEPRKSQFEQIQVSIQRVLDYLCHQFLVLKFVSVDSYLEVKSKLIEIADHVGFTDLESCPLGCHYDFCYIGDPRNTCYRFNNRKNLLILQKS